MKKTKWLAVGVLVMIVAGMVNSIFGMIEAPSIQGASATKGIDRSSDRPWFDVQEDNPIRNLPDADQSGLLAAIDEYEEGGSVPDDMAQLLHSYQTMNRDKFDGNPWYPFFEGVGYLLLEDSKTFETISNRLFSMETLTGDHLSWMGMFLDSWGFHDYAWSYFEGSIRQYVLEGNSMDDDNVLLPNPLFFPMQRLKMFLTEGKSQVAIKRFNDLIKMNPRIENMYGFYMQIARYYESEGIENLAPLFKKLAAKQFRGRASFNPQTIVEGDCYLTAMAVTLFMFLVYMVVLRFKYHGIARNARQQAGDTRKKRECRFFCWRHSPYYYIRPGEFVFLLVMAGFLLVLPSNAMSVVWSIGRGATLPENFASGRYGLPESKQILANLKTEYGDTPEFKRFYAYCLAQEGDYGAVRVLLEPAIEENSDDVSAWVNLAVVEYRDGNNALAGRLIGHAMDLAPNRLEVVHDYRVITGQKTAFPEWFERLKASEDLETTIQIVCNNYDAVWPNAMAVICGDGSDTLFMSDGGHFLRLWSKEPLTLRSRVISILELSRLFVAKNPTGFFPMEVKKFIWLFLCVMVGYFCIVFIKSAGCPKGRNVFRCAECGKVFWGRQMNEVPAGSSPGSGGVLLCSECAGKVRYDDDGFLNGKSHRLRLRWIPFAGAFREGRPVTATILLTLFLFFLVSFIFANSSVLGVYGALGYFSSVAFWAGAYTPLPEAFSMHFAGTYSTVLVLGMAVSILLSLIAARPRVAER